LTGCEHNTLNSSRWKPGRCAVNDTAAAALLNVTRFTSTNVCFSRWRYLLDIEVAHGCPLARRRLPVLNDMNFGSRSDFPALDHQVARNGKQPMPNAG
jgi:hypothetical protein